MSTRAHSPPPFREARRRRCQGTTCWRTEFTVPSCPLLESWPAPEQDDVIRILASTDFIISSAIEFVKLTEDLPERYSSLRSTNDNRSEMESERKHSCARALTIGASNPHGRRTETPTPLAVRPLGPLCVSTTLCLSSRVYIGPRRHYVSY